MRKISYVLNIVYSMQYANQTNLEKTYRKTIRTDGVELWIETCTENNNNKN